MKPFDGFTVTRDDTHGITKHELVCDACGYRISLFTQSDVGVGERLAAKARGHRVWCTNGASHPRTPATFLAASIRSYAIPGYTLTALEADRLNRLAEAVEELGR